MVEKSNEEQIDLDRLNDGISEIRPYKSKQAKLEEKQARLEQKQAKAEERKAKQESKKTISEDEAPADSEKVILPKKTENIIDDDEFVIDFDAIEKIAYTVTDGDEDDTDGGANEFFGESDYDEDSKKKSSLKGTTKAILAAAITFFIIVVGYSTVAFGRIPFIRDLRDLWIETAMWTDQHKWLATSFFPDWLIKDVMTGYSDVKDMGVTEIKKENESPFGDVIDPSTLVVGEPDSKGNKVYANNIEEGIVILEVKSDNYTGKLIIVDDPSRVFLGVTDYKGSRGEFICDFLEKENAIVGTNASGFVDPGGVGVAAQLTGQCVSNGEYWGTNDSRYTLIGFDDNDRLVIGGTDDWESYNIRDGMQYRPTLILNGEKVVEDSAGWGLQPRTTIGQCENGVVLMLVMDGRKPGYSLGATMEDCADILLSYGAVNAAACDGGSSSVVGYDGEVINIPSARNMPTGRYLPNAWLVRRKSIN